MRANEIVEARRSRERRAAWARRGWLVVPLGMSGALTAVELGVLALPAWALYLLIAAIPGAALLDSAVKGSREKRIGAKKDGDIDRYKACVALAAEIHEFTGIDLTVIGVSVWGIHDPKAKWGRSGPVPSLYRLTRFRVSAHPMPSNASWIKGRGVIGRCWEKEETTFANWGPLQRSCAGATGMSESKWSNLSEDRRWGFEREQFLEAIRKYAQVLAVPIKDEHGVFMGCVSVDIPTADLDLVPALPTDVRLDSGRVRSSMTRAAQSLSGLL